jgi:signal peptidase I
MSEKTREKLKKELQSWIIVILVVLVIKATFIEAMVIPTPSMENVLLIGDALMVNRFIFGVKLPIPFTNRQIPLIPGQKPRRGDIVAFLSPLESKNLVKRCVALEGDTVQVINKALYVNGRKMEEPYARYLDPEVQPGVVIDRKSYQVNWIAGDLYKLFGLRLRDNFGPVVVPKDHFFMMGDNRDNSFDSRFWGPLHRKYLLGKPLFIFFSFDPGGPAENLLQLLRVWQWKGIRPNRIGKVIF